MKDEDYIHLKCILDFENTMDKARYPVGWEWSDVSLHPSIIMRLITNGFVNIPYKSHSHTYYKLTDKGRLVAEQSLEEPSTENIVIPEITNEIFGDIVNYDDVKELIVTSLVLDKPVHVLLFGPPALAKTMFLRSLEQFGGSLAMWVSGSATSQAGLWDALAERRPRWLLVDELEKMDISDTASLLNLMENGRLVRTKHRRNLDIELNCWVIATANTLSRLTPELKSRFAIVEVRDYDTTDFIKVVNNVLTRREGLDEKTASEVATALVGKTRDIRDAVRIARMSQKISVQEAIRLIFKR